MVLFYSLVLSNHASTGRFYLVFWPLEMAVTVVAESKFADPSPEKLLVGDDCSMRERNSCYKGKVAAIGEQSYMYTHVPVSVNITHVHVAMVTNIYNSFAHIGTEVEMKAIETRFLLKPSFIPPSFSYDYHFPGPSYEPPSSSNSHHFPGPSYSSGQKKVPVPFSYNGHITVNRLRSIPVLRSCESIVGTVWENNCCSIVLTCAAIRPKQRWCSVLTNCSEFCSTFFRATRAQPLPIC